MIATMQKAGVFSSLPTNGEGSLFLPCPESCRLLLVLPGASGISGGPGYSSLAGWFWLRSYNVLLLPPPGSRGESGEYDMARWLDKSSSIVESLRSDREIRAINAIGTCAGGAIAAHLLNRNSCANSAKALALFETPLRWSAAHMTEFENHSFEAGIRPSATCYTDLLHLADALTHGNDASLFAHGKDLKMPFTADDLAEVKQVLSGHRIVTIEHAGHSLLKRGPCRSLLTFCEAALNHFELYGN